MSVARVVCDKKAYVFSCSGRPDTALKSALVGAAHTPFNNDMSVETDVRKSTNKTAETSQMSRNNFSASSR